jgi:hypothetical protein
MSRGRPLGSRNNAGGPAQALLESYAERLAGKCLSLAFKGDTKALQMCLDRILPARRELPLKIGRLPLTTIGDLSKASERVVAQVACGRLTTAQGHSLSELIERRRKVLESEELDRRLKVLEERL